MSEQSLHQPFEYVGDERSRILILGSFPSVKSRESGFYYGHPQNRFWRMLAMAFHQAVPISIEQKKALLLSNGLALWDAAESCRISASSDSSIRQAVPADLSPIFRLAPIASVLCNGAAAYTLYCRYQQSKLGIAAVRLPSTSPANAAFSLDKLLSCWTPYLITPSQP